MPPRRSNKGLSVKPTKTESPFPYGRVCVAWLGKKSDSPMQVLFFCTNRCLVGKRGGFHVFVFNV